MNALIRSMKTQFAENTAITDVVGERCKFVINLQDEQNYPVVVYNAREIGRITKDNAREYDLTVFVMATKVADLLDIYEVCKDVMDTATTDFESVFVGSSYPDVLEGRDDVYIIDLNYKVEY